MLKKNEEFAKRKRDRQTDRETETERDRERETETERQIPSTCGLATPYFYCRPTIPVNSPHPSTHPPRPTTTTTTTPISLTPSPHHHHTSTQGELGTRLHKTPAEILASTNQLFSCRKAASHDCCSCCCCCCCDKRPLLYVAACSWYR